MKADFKTSYPMDRNGLVHVNLSGREIQILVAGMAIGSAKAAHRGVDSIEYEMEWVRPTVKLARWIDMKYGHDFIESRYVVSRWIAGLYHFMYIDKSEDAVNLRLYLENILDGRDCIHDF